MAHLLRLISPAGLAGRAEFVWVSVGLVVAELVAVAGLHLVFSRLGLSSNGVAIAYLASLVVTGWMFLAVVIRRLHDFGESGGLLVFPMLIGALLVWLADSRRMGPGALVVWVAAGLAVAAYVFLATQEGMAGLPGSPATPPSRRPLSAEEAAAAADRARARMQSLALPTLLLTPAGHATFSKLGGRPELPVGVDWPQGLSSARIFVAQLDLAEVRSGGGPDWLPGQGQLYFFYDEDGWDSLQLVTCLASDDPPGPERRAPKGYEPDPMFAERRVAFQPMTSIPSTDWLGEDLAGLDTEAFDALVEVSDKPFGDDPQHRIGGYASEIQGAQMELECEFRTRGVPQNYYDVPPTILEGSKGWRLLLQVDSDDELGMNWIDTGRLYVFIREQDARAGDFTKTATISQFY